MSEDTKTYYSNGKLLITAEYLVLDGAKALALPTKYGQSLRVKATNSERVEWKSYNELNEVWFEDSFTFKNTSKELHIKSTSNNEISKRLIDLFKAIRQLNPEFLKSKKGFSIETHQDFNRLWGLGTSSTLINNLAQWANVDAYKLLKLTFGGSGYDVACAIANTCITYQLISRSTEISESSLHEKRRIKEVRFSPIFSDKLYFVYLNQKQNSRTGIADYKNNPSALTSEIIEINVITEAMVNCIELSDFQKLMDEHESIISKIIKQIPVKEHLFNDFDGSVKSLGAWGGDFVLVASKENPATYFKSKGFDTIIPYLKMIKTKKRPYTL